MKLEHSFTVPVGIEDAWKILLDIERIGPCMPGAAIDSVDGDDFTGTVKVKLGPIGLTYKGKASFIEKDDVAHRAVIDARGRDARGNGTASAKVTAVLVEAGATTTVQVNTDLDITGKPAQFGRGVMVDVGNKLIGQFADNLAATLQEDQDVAVAAAAAPAGDAQSAPAATGASGAAGGSAANGTTPAGTTANGSAGTAPAAEPAPGAAAKPVATPRPAPKRDVEPINLIESAGPAVAKRLAPVIALAAVVLLVVRWRRHR